MNQSQPSVIIAVVRDISFLLLEKRHPPTSTLFPYTTLFRSSASGTERPCGGFEPRPDLRSDARHQLRGNARVIGIEPGDLVDRKSTRLNSSHMSISYAVFCLKKKKSLVKLHQENFGFDPRNR